MIHEKNKNKQPLSSFYILGLAFGTCQIIISDIRVQED